MLIYTMIDSRLHVFRDIAGATSSPIDIETLRAEPQCYGDSFPLRSGVGWVGETGATLYESFDRSVIVDVQHCTQACKVCKTVCTKSAVIEKTVEHPEMFLDRFGKFPLFSRRFQAFALSELRITAVECLLKKSLYGFCRSPQSSRSSEFQVTKKL